MKSDPILILGMHRSGTSCLTGTLEAAGLCLGEVFTTNRHNKKGNRENAKVMHLNTAVLRHSGGTWAKPPASLSWTEAHRKARDSIIESLQRRRAAPWGFKDPRLTFTLPFWQEAIPRPQLVASFRHPNAVAASLAARNRTDRDDALALWTQYNEKLLGYLETSPFPIVCFDVDREQYLNDMDRLCHRLALKPTNKDTPFFEAELRRQRFDDDRVLPDHTAAIYARLTAHYQRQFHS